MLLRTNWEAPQAHQHLMARCCRKYTFSRRLEMHRGGYTGKNHSPQLDVSWYVFNNEHKALTQTEVLPPTAAKCCRHGTATNFGFRATGITAYLKNGGTLESAAIMANHASTRTTQLYDRRRDDVSLDEVERILI
jgi:hypothetical protein